jgi:transposase-like protein
MHLCVRLPQIEPKVIEAPQQCPLRNATTHRRCTGRAFKVHQRLCVKPVRDLKQAQVWAVRYRCLKCNRTFRVYPRNVSHAQQSDALNALSVLLYLLGLSYQGVVDLLTALQHPLSVGTVFANVQAAGKRVRCLQRQWQKGQAGQVKVMGIDCTHVKCLTHDTIVAVATNILTGAPLTIDVVRAETAMQLTAWIRDLAKHLGVEILVTDDADSMKNVADSLGVQHQICRAHVNRNVHDLVAALGTKALEHPDRVPWELPDLTVEQFLEDVQTVEDLIKGLPYDGQAQMLALAARYQAAPPPSQNQRATMWYRLRLLTLDWSENWARLSLFQRWRLGKQKLDGTNNATEQVIGQCIKERYRTMRTYKRTRSIERVSSLIGWLWVQRTDYDLGVVIRR